MDENLPLITSNLKQEFQFTFYYVFRLYDVCETNSHHRPLKNRNHVICNENLIFCLYRFQEG